MQYDQKTYYLELRKRNEKVSGAGFVMLECRDGNCKIVLQISGVPKSLNGAYEAKLSGAAKTLRMGTVEINEGRGRLELRGLQAVNILESGLPVDALEELHISLPNNAEIYGRLGEFEGAKDEGEKQENKQENKQEDFGESAVKQEISMLENRQTEHGKTSASPDTEADGQAHLKAADRQEDSDPEPTITVDREASQMTLKAGKWEQLDAIYPHIVPFGDRRRYLQISPGDFVILKEKSYRKVNNSFLLHGYFTYKHLILCKMLKRGEAVYYVGVPGRFFDREKEVALLFGFESFEGGMEPAKEGDFGYYMMRVEL